MARRRQSGKTEIGTKYPLEYIEWVDHHATGGWTEEGDLDHAPTLCKSIGWLLKEDNKAVTLAASISPPRTVGNTQYILKNCILKRRAS